MTLKRHPMRANVSLLEHMNPQLVGLGYRMHVPVYLTAVTKHDDIRNTLILYKFCIPSR